MEETIHGQDRELQRMREEVRRSDADTKNAHVAQQNSQMVQENAEKHAETLRQLLLQVILSCSRNGGSGRLCLHHVWDGCIIMCGMAGAAACDALPRAQ